LNNLVIEIMLLAKQQIGT